MVANDNGGKQSSASQEKEGMSRRNFLKNAGLISGGIIGSGLLGGFIGHQWWSESEEENGTETAPNFNEARIFFNRREDFSVLSWATERILPEDENGPGAIALGVPYFIDRQLAGAWGSNTEEYMMGPFIEGEDTQGFQSALNRGEIFIQGVRKINEVSQNEFGNPFEDLEEEQQNEVLSMFDNGEVDLQGADGQTFFNMLIQATLEGAYSDPLYGGNRNMDGWRMKEYPGPQMTYINEIEDEEFIYMDPISLSDYNA